MEPNLIGIRLDELGVTHALDRFGSLYSLVLPVDHPHAVETLTEAQRLQLIRGAQVAMRRRLQLLLARPSP